MPDHVLQDGTAKAEAAPASAEEQEWMKKAIACLPEHQQKPFAAVQQDVNPFKQRGQAKQLRLTG
jgi:DNA-directed RNA polymerase specialized sigma24 family protein